MIRPEVILAGAVVGLLVGLTGVGGGSLLTPMLILVFHVRAATAIGTGVVWMGITKLLGAGRHYRLGTVNRQLVRYLCLGGIPGTVLGCSFTVMLVHWFPNREDAILTRILALTLILIALLMYYQALLGKVWDGRLTEGEWMGPRRKPFTVLVGFLGGLTLGVTSSGSGSLVVVLLVALYPLAAATIVGSDIMYGAVVASLATILHGTFGHIAGPMLFNLLLGSLPGIYVGSSLCARLPERVVRPVMATLLFITGVKMA